MSLLSIGLKARCKAGDTMHHLVRLVPSIVLAVSVVIWLTAGTASASEWETTEGLFAASMDQLEAADIDTQSWNAQLDLRLEKNLGARHQIIIDADWDYGQVRDAVTATRSLSPDVVDVDIKLLRETRSPFALFLSINYLSENDLKPAVLGLGFGYRARLLGGLIAELSLQRTKDITSSLNAQAGYRLALSYKQPLMRDLELWADVRSQGGFETGATRQEFLEIRALYRLASRLKLTYTQRIENPLQFEASRKHTRLLLAYDLR